MTSSPLRGTKVTCDGAVWLPCDTVRTFYGGVMTYVIGSACVDVMDKACVQECPADCIYEGARSLYINPDECVDCGACRLVCHVEAIEWETDLPEDERWHIDDNAAFFQTVLPGRSSRWVIPVAHNPSAGWVSTRRWWQRCPQTAVRSPSLTH